MVSWRHLVVEQRLAISPRPWGHLALLLLSDGTADPVRIERFHLMRAVLGGVLAASVLVSPSRIGWTV